MNHSATLTGPIGRAILAAACLAASTSALAWDAYSAGSGAHCHHARSPVVWHLADRAPVELDPNSVVPLIDEGLRRWHTPGCGVPEVQFGGVLDVDTRTTPDALDAVGDNLFVFIRTREAWADQGNSPLWIALTTVTHDDESGRIIDADIEFNDAGFRFADADEAPVDAVDIRSVIAHEAGHFWGLAHSDIAGATMSERYSLLPTPTAARTLEPDDRAGICALYPAPDGCQAGATKRPPLWLLAAIGALLWRWRRCASFRNKRSFRARRMRACQQRRPNEGPASIVEFG